MENRVHKQHSRQWQHQPVPPVVLTIAGSDNSGGAGLQADVKTFTTLGTYGTTAVTAVVAEHPGRVASITAVPARAVAEQIRLVFESLPVAAVKTGMLQSAAIIRAVVRELQAHAGGVPLVVDPVMLSSSGDRLLEDAAIATLREELLPLATVITPNRDEAALLAGCAIRNVTQLERAGRALASQTGRAVLAKGGHLGGTEAIDLLCQPPGPKTPQGQVRWYRAPLVPGVDPHGTGCTYSAAIAAELAKGRPLAQAVGAAKRFITRAIRTRLPLGEYELLNQLPDPTLPPARSRR